MNSPSTWNRRKFLARSLGASVALGTAGIGSLAACSTGTTGPSVEDQNSGFKLPDYIPFEGVKADIPSTSPYVMHSYFKFPTQRVNVYDSPPIKSGKPVSILTSVNTTIPPSVNDNTFWQELNKRAGAAIEYNMAPSGKDYEAKLNVTIAGNEFPEIVSMRPVPGMPQLMEKNFTDLTEYLAGDNIKKYPALANIPTTSWYSCIFNGKIYGIPINRAAERTQLLMRADLIKEKSGNDQFTSFAEFRELCKTVTDGSRRRWAMGNVPGALLLVQEMLSIPNIWAQKDGKFTFYGEVEEMKQALDSTAQLWKDGVFHPDTLASGTQLASWIGSGIVCMNNGGPGAASYLNDYKKESPNSAISWRTPPKYNGGGDAVKYMGTAIYGGTTAPTVLRKNSKERVEELLDFLNFLASPLGTEEYMENIYGVEGVHYTLQSGEPVPTDKGKLERNLPVNYTVGPPVVNYILGHPEATKAYNEYQVANAKVALPHGNLGLFSPTELSKGATLTKNLDNLILDIVSGRKPVSAWDDGMASWKSGGGETIRKEYEVAFEAVQG